MSEFKFACPVCGQHILCDSVKSGSPMECPTCFRKIVVPQAPRGADSKLLLTAAQFQTRVGPKGPVEGEATNGRRSTNRANVVVAFALSGVVAAALGAGYLYRGKIFKRSEAGAETKSPAASARVECDTNWTLNLAERSLPETRAAGRINGRDFGLERASVQGGLLSFRQGSRTPREIAITIHLFARRGEDLAGQSVTIDTSRTNAPKVTLRWRDDQEQPVTRTVREGYALRLEFGQVAGGLLPGKIYLCAPDDAKSWVAGSFEAEIRKPPVARTPKTSRPAPPTVANP